MGTRLNCEVCDHLHESTKIVTIVKENKKEIQLLVCAFCALLLAGQPGYHP